MQHTCRSLIYGHEDHSLAFTAQIRTIDGDALISRSRRNRGGQGMFACLLKAAGKSRHVTLLKTSADTLARRGFPPSRCRSYLRRACPLFIAVALIALFFAWKRIYRPLRNAWRARFAPCRKPNASTKSCSGS